MNANNIRELSQRLVELERMISICGKSGGPISVSYSNWDGDQRIEECMVNTVKVEIKRICEHEAEIVRELILREAMGDLMRDVEVPVSAIPPPDTDNLGIGKDF